MKTQWVAVLGGAYGYDKAQLVAAYRCGVELARRGKHIITGATTGVPLAASLGAKDGGGMVIGISPARSAAEHVDVYRKPLNPADLVIYSGLSVEGRAPLILRSAGAAIFIGGEMGTLGEFAAGWLCGCPYLGLLESCGGITADLRRIAASVQTVWGSTVLTADEPRQLVDLLCERLDSTPAPAWLDRQAAACADVAAMLDEVRSC